MVCPVRPRTQSNDGRCGLLPWPARRPAHIQHQHSLCEWFACRTARPRPCAPARSSRTCIQSAVRGPARPERARRSRLQQSAPRAPPRNLRLQQNGVPIRLRTRAKAGSKTARREALRDSTASSHARPSVPRSRSPHRAHTRITSTIRADRSSHSTGRTLHARVHRLAGEVNIGCADGSRQRAPAAVTRGVSDGLRRLAGRATSRQRTHLHLQHGAPTEPRPAPH